MTQDDVDEMDYIQPEEYSKEQKVYAILSWEMQTRSEEYILDIVNEILEAQK